MGIQINLFYHEFTMNHIKKSCGFHEQRKAETIMETYLKTLLENAPCSQSTAFALYVALVNNLVRGDYQLPILKAQFGFYNHNTPAAFREHVGSAPQVFILTVIKFCENHF